MHALRAGGPGGRDRSAGGNGGAGNAWAFGVGAAAPARPGRMSSDDAARDRLVDVVLDESIGRSTPDVEHERAVAIFDLIEENSFRPVGDDAGGPYRLRLSLADSRLVMEITRENGDHVVTHILSL